MAQSFSAIALFFVAFTGFLQNPPEDLLSLCDTKIVLEQLEVEQTEDSLISLLSDQKKVEVDTTELDKAVKVLRVGSFKERKNAKKTLTTAGMEYRDYFIKLCEDSDPEVSETAKAILDNFASKELAVKAMGVNDDVIKLFAIRRLSELKSTKSLKTINTLKSSKNMDISMEAERASAIIQGITPKRSKRNEATQKILKMIPNNTGFVAALDLTEPEKNIKLVDLLGPMKKVPGMNIEQMMPMFYRFLPKIVQKVGNPQIDSLVFVSSQELGIKDDSNWIGFIGVGRYNSQKIKKLLTDQKMELKKLNGVEYWTERWGPSICPLNNELIIFSFGDRESNHMAKMLENIKGGNSSNRVPDISTLSSRLVVSGQFSKSQKEKMQKEIHAELARIEGRKGNGIEVQKAMLNLGLLCTSSESLKGKYENEIIVIKAEMNNEENAEKMVKAIARADLEIREALKTIPLPLVKIFDLNKKFAKAESSSKTVTLKIKGKILDLLGMIPAMMMTERRQEVPEVEVHIEDIEEVEIEPPPVEEP